MDKILSVIEPIQLYVFFTCIVAFVFLDKEKLLNRLVLLMVSLLAITELAASVLIFHNTEIELLYSISMPIHNSLWIVALYLVNNRMRIIKYVLWFYTVFSAINFSLLEGKEAFNHYTFIVGAFLYLIIFIITSFGRLRTEDFSYFRSNHFLLLCAPILLFFGLSFVFGFNSIKLARTVVFNGMYLYQIIVLFVNIVYYSLLNLYVFKEKRKHGRR